MTTPPSKSEAERPAQDVPEWLTPQEPTQFAEEPRQSSGFEEPRQTPILEAPASRKQQGMVKSLVIIFLLWSVCGGVGQLVRKARDAGLPRNPEMARYDMQAYWACKDYVVAGLKNPDRPKFSAVDYRVAHQANGDYLITSSVSYRRSGWLQSADWQCTVRRNGENFELVDLKVE
jgi:hypothetical protein